MKCDQLGEKAGSGSSCSVDAIQGGLLTWSSLGYVSHVYLASSAPAALKASVVMYDFDSVIVVCYGST